MYMTDQQLLVLWLQIAAVFLAFFGLAGFLIYATAPKRQRGRAWWTWLGALGRIVGVIGLVVVAMLGLTVGKNSRLN